MAVINLSRGLVALVDDSDLELVSQFSWAAMPRRARSGGYYAFRSIKYADCATVYLHRAILAADPGQIVDHINGDGLDNRRANLRFANASQNSANCRLPKNPSGFRGVMAERGKFRASVGGKQNLWRGPWRDRAADAARDYDGEALRRFGEFAHLNFAAE